MKLKEYIYNVYNLYLKIILHYKFRNIIKILTGGH